MAPAILADSDDDGEAEDLAPDAVQQEASNNNSGYDTFQAYHAAQENSTGSTERLRRQIASAERGLCINSAPVASVSQTSPSRKVHARNFTTWPEPAASDRAAERGVKRAKSMKTFSSTHQSKSGDGENVAMSSGRQSDRVSDHSGQHSSGGLPSGSIGQDFLIHEPTVMFPESGSTVEDPSSMQRQLFDNAVRGEGSEQMVSRTSKSQGFKEAGAEMSSTEWSAWTDSSHDKNRDQEQAEKEHNDGEGGDVGAGSETKDMMDQEAAEGNALLDVDSRVFTSAVDGIGNRSDVSKPAASPTVQIPQAERSLGSPEQASQTSTKKRKRKTIDADGSDDELAALGLQKEMYKPRPSRRRATHSAEDNASLVSLSQEKTKSKSSKRRKTTQADSSHGHQSQQKVEAETLEPISVDMSHNPSELGLSETARSKEKDTSQTKDTSDESLHTNHSNDKSQEDSLSQQEPVSSSTSKQEDDVFVKPPKPTPKAKTKTKSRRSQTTIYEDLTKFSEPERSPSLSQQQASRKSALRDLHNDEDHSSSPRKRKREISVAEEKMSENEIVNDELQEDKPPPPKKRGRGRPRKSSPKPQPKSSERVLEDSEDGGDPDELVKGVDSPRKDSRRAASKNQNSKPSTEDPTFNSNNETEEDGGKETSAPAKQSPDETVTTSPANSDEYQQKEVSPSSASMTTATSAPETGKSSKDTPAKSAAAVQSKHSPTSHSPLKSSCKVPLRVGLNKRQRIPSLLRTIKPPRPR